MNSAQGSGRYQWKALLLGAAIIILYIKVKGYWFKWKLIIKVKDRTKVEQKFEKELKKNPFLDANAILATYEKEMDAHFSDDFDYYCTCEEYYEPYVEDFDDRISEIESMLEKYGLELIDDEYTCGESDYY